MRSVQTHLSARRAELAEHRFFAALDVGGLRSVAAFAPALAFWVMTFQDLLRLNVERTRDPRIRRIVELHRAEDAGHDEWYLHDLSLIEPSPMGLRELFGPGQQATRDASFALVTEVFRPLDDRLRVVIVSALESVGQLFFHRVVEATGEESTGLRYFTRTHLAREEDHSLRKENADSDEAILAELEGALADEACALIDRVYEAFDGLFDGLLRAQLEVSHAERPRPALAGGWSVHGRPR